MTGQTGPYITGIIHTTKQTGIIPRHKRNGQNPPPDKSDEIDRKSSANNTKIFQKNISEGGIRMDFDAMAMTWDTDRREHRSQIIASEMAAVFLGETYHKALEFGCGTGMISFQLRDILREITLVDSSEKMIRVLQNKIKDNGIHNMDAVALDLTRGGKLTRYFDLIYMSMALHHIVDIEKLLTYLRTHLDEDGSLCIVDLVSDDGSFHKAEKEFDGHNGFDPDALGKLLEKIGFTGVSSRVFYTDTKVVEGQEVPYSLFILTAKKSGS
jgi:ubiquinone/menaquinone biosynthesis C-methylase UbiE